MEDALKRLENMIQDEAQMANAHAVREIKDTPVSEDSSVSIVDVPLPGPSIGNRVGHIDPAVSYAYDMEGNIDEMNRSWPIRLLCADAKD